MQRNDRLSGYVWILLAAFFWSLIGVISKICMSAGVSPLETAFWRAAFGGALFLVHAALHKGLFIRPRDAGIFLLFGVWGVGVFFGATQYAIQLSGAAMAVVLLSLTLILFLIQKYYLEKRTYATLTGKASRARMLIADKSVTRPLTILCSLFSAFVILMYVSIPFGALFNLWGRDYSLTFKHFEYMFKYSGLKAFRDSFVLSSSHRPSPRCFP